MRRSDRPSIQLLGRIMAGTEKRSRSNKETDDGGRGYAVETRCTRVRALLTPPIQAPGLRAPCGHADLFGARNIEQARILAVEPPKRIRRRIGKRKPLDLRMPFNSSPRRLSAEAGARPSLQRG